MSDIHSCYVADAVCTVSELCCSGKPIWHVGEYTWKSCCNLIWLVEKNYNYKIWFVAGAVYCVYCELTVLRWKTSLTCWWKFMFCCNLIWLVEKNYKYGITVFFTAWTVCTSLENHFDNNIKSEVNKKVQVKVPMIIPLQVAGKDKKKLIKTEKGDRSASPWPPSTAVTTHCNGA